MSQGQITSSWLIESREKDRPTHKLIIRKESLVSLINDDRDAIIGRDIHPSLVDDRTNVGDYGGVKF